MLLLIPGPVTTRPEVRQALTRDIAPWDNEFRGFVARLRTRILHLAGGVEGVHATVPLQGCGHFITEAALRTFLPPGGRILIPATGAYAGRMIRLAEEAGRVPVPLPIGLTDPTDPDAVADALAADPTLSHVGMVYSETGSGVIHDVHAIGAVVRKAGRRMILDAISAFGALPLDLSVMPEVDAAVFSANKCLEALPGITFAVARVDRLSACTGNAGSWSFDLSDIYDYSTHGGGGVFRFTPPAQILAALDVALNFLDAEGQPARLARYSENMRNLVRWDPGSRPYAVVGTCAPGTGARQRSCTGRSGVGPAGLRGRVETTRNPDQQLLHHAVTDISRWLHWGDHTRRHGGRG